MSDVYDLIIEDPATGSGESMEFVVAGSSINVSVYPEAALLDAESASLMLKDPAGTWVEVFDSESQVLLNGLNPQVTIIGPGTYRLEWSARTTATGAFIKS